MLSAGQQQRASLVRALARMSKALKNTKTNGRRQGLIFACVFIYNHNMHMARYL